MDRCPHCSRTLRLNGDRCRGCRGVVPFVDEVEAVPVEEWGRPRRKRRDVATPEPLFGGLTRRWGVWAALVTFVLGWGSLIALCLSLPNADPVGRVAIALIAGPFLSAAAALAAGLLFEALQLTWGWAFGPKAERLMKPEGSTPSWAGPACLGLMLGIPAVAATVGFFIDPINAGLGMALGGLCVGLPLALLAAGVVLLIARAM